DSPAVRVILSAMKWLDYPGDSVARFHVARSALGNFWGLDSESIPFPRSENEAKAEALRGSLLQDGYGVTVEHWVRLLLPGFDDRERQRLHQLVDLAFLFDRQKTIRPYDFVRYVTHQKVSDPTSSNIRVMNIHQAKGLEFDVVYLPDLEGGMAGQPPPFVTARPRPTERVSAVSPYLNQSLQAIMPPPLPERVRHWKSHQISESLCLFYVAMTRAARALYFVTKAPKSNTGNLTQTWSGLVLATLNDGRVMEDGESGCEWGEADWYEQGQFPPIVEPEPILLQARPLKFSTGEAQASRLIRSTSPSAQEGGGNVEVAQVLRRGATQAMLRGTAVHAIFEQIKWWNREVDEKTILNWLAAYALPTKERQELAEQIGQLLRSDTALGIMDEIQYRLWLKAKWANLSHVEVNLDVQTEYEFATIMDQQMWRGAIDRLVWVRSESKLEAADIIDFKTDRVETAEGLVLQERVDYYRPQLEAYRRALSKMTCLPESRISTRLWFVQTNEIVEV
ncbi:MAG: 3'-5' exonuclease, partial [Planctomycetota bacterium]|nr:3'-5' exonuclease [Planctomycetota bacterium]